MKKKLIALLEEGRKRQDTQSRFLKHGKEGPYHFLENLNFTLGLFQTKNSENIQEAKELLFRLLHYDIKPVGQYPLYLSDYPRWQDSLSAAKALQIFLPIYETFGEVLGSPLKLLLEERIQKAYSSSLRLLLQKRMRGRSLLLLSFVTFSYERIFKSDEKHGEEALSKFTHCLSDFPKTKDALAELYGMLIQVPEHLLKDLREEVVSQFKKVSHGALGYIGPIHDEEFIETELSPSLFEAFIKDEPTDCMEALSYYPKAWELEAQNDKSYAYSYFDQDYSTKKIPQSRACPFFLTWKEKEQVGSMVLKASRADVSCQEIEDKFLRYEFTIDESFEGGRKKGEEIIIYLKKLDDLRLHIDQVRATCFQMDDTLTIESEKLKMELKFHLLSGDGTWMGHIAFGDRSSPNGLQEVKMPPDWKVFLRTIRRSSPVKLALDIKFSIS